MRTLSHGRQLVLAILCGLLTALPALAQAGSEISGRVSNRDTGEYLQSAQIRLSGTAQATFTDSTGYFDFPNVPPGEYQIEVIYPGVGRAVEPVSVAPQTRVRRDIAVKSDVVQMSAFEVQAISEGNALALSKQRASQSIRNVLSVDAYGNVTDANVGNMLRLVPGVTTADADGDARFAVIRGLSPSLSTMTINGLPVATAQSNGSQQLDLHSTNNLSTIEVVKAPTPDMEHDAIGGSVNLTSRSAFDRKDRVLDFTVGSGYMEMLQKWNRNALLSWADKFAHNKLGVTFNANYFDSSGGTQSVNHTVRYNRPYGVGYFVTNNVHELNSVRLNDQQFNRKRYSTSSRVDYRFSDDFRVYADLGYSAYKDERINRDNQWNIAKNPVTGQPLFDDGVTTIAWPLNGAPINTAVAGLTTGIVNVGPSTGFIRMRASSIKFNTVLYNVGTGFLLKKPTYRLDGDFSYSSIKGKQDWMVPIEVQLDGFQMEAVRAPDPYWPKLTITGQGVTTVAPAVLAPALVYRDPSQLVNYTTRRTSDTNNQNNTEELYGAALHFSKIFRLGARALSVKVGGKYRGKSKVNNSNIERWGFNADPAVLATLLDQSFKPVGPLYDHYSGLLRPPWPDLQKYNALIKSDPAGKVTLDALQTARQSLLNDWKAAEDVAMGYVMGTLDLTPKLKVIAGIHYEGTTWATQGFGIRPRRPGDPTFADDVTQITDPLTGATIQLAQFTFIRQNDSGDYGKFSPGLHLRYEFRRNIVFRAAYTETFSRPAYTLLVPKAAIDEINSQINPGNPNLKAAQAQNFDLSVEAYLPSVGVVSLGLFRKNVDGFIFSNQYRLFQSADDIAKKQSFGVPPQLLNNLWTVIQMVNGEGASVHGAEAAYMQQLRFLPWHLDGLGVLANVTLLKSTSKIATRAGETFPLIDQSDLTYSVGASYEKFGFSGRAIGTYRGKHLREVTDKRPEDVYADGRLVWNVSASYSINRTWSLFADLLNLTDSPFRQYTGYRHVPATNNNYGRTYNFGIKSRF